ncbi:MAG: hypothetical protein B0W54_06890 [Cellvibrio sp. 79]|nr:MAG: hypothetical protein B0W54_06890 [Cellvibrio sp. 79]
MKILNRSILLLLASFSFAANATIIDIEYSGVIYSVSSDNAHFDFNIGKRITGAMRVDLSRGDEQPVETPGMVYYTSQGPGAGMISEPGQPVPVHSSHYLYAYNNAEPRTNHDYAFFSHAISDETFYKTVTLSIRLGAREWISSTSLADIDLLIDDPEQLKNSMGTSYRAVFAPDATIYASAAMRMSLDYLKVVSSNPAPVPETGSLSLVILGLVALCIRQIHGRRKLLLQGRDTNKTVRP